MLSFLKKIILNQDKQVDNTAAQQSSAKTRRVIKPPAAKNITKIFKSIDDTDLRFVLLEHRDKFTNDLDFIKSSLGFKTYVKCLAIVHQQSSLIYPCSDRVYKFWSVFFTHYPREYRRFLQLNIDNYLRYPDIKIHDEPSRKKMIEHLFQVYEIENQNSNQVNDDFIFKHYGFDDFVVKNTK